uniref:Beta-defensin-like domain-containing protein n=1 Tax=Pelusios castaneus TaxID=367368 RepID=A0A8C8S889_9SAUR
NYLVYLFAERGLIGRSFCHRRRGACLLFRCPLFTRRIGRCGIFSPCCRAVRTGLQKEDILV